MNSQISEDVDSDSDDGNISKLSWNKLQNACHSVTCKLFTFLM